jgi:hypothetical protein
MKGLPQVGFVLATGQVAQWRQRVITMNMETCSGIAFLLGA